MSGVDVLDSMRRSVNVSKCNADAFPESRILRAYAEDAEQARAAVAALVEVATELLEYRVGTYPARGDLRDNAGSRAQIDALATALAACRGGK